MSTVNVKMTAIADEIRTLSGTTDPMGLDAMATNANEANTEVTSQASLISQIQTALEGKAGGGGGGGGNVETCTVTFAYADSTPSMFDGTQTVYYIDANGQTKSEIWVPDETVITIIKGSFIVVTEWTSMSSQTNAVHLTELDYGTRKTFEITGNSTFGYAA